MLRRIVKRFIKVIKDQRGFIVSGAVAGTLGTAALLGGGAAAAGGLFGGDKKEDPLAGIRQQLQQLAAGVPGLVSRRKEQIGDIFGEAREKGLEGIPEETRATRGFGRSSIEERLRTELLDKLARGQAESELQAEFEGLGMQSQLLGQVGGFTPRTEEPTFGEELFGGLGELGGQAIRGQHELGQFEDLFERMRKRELIEGRPTVAGGQ